MRYIKRNFKNIRVHDAIYKNRRAPANFRKLINLKNMNMIDTQLTKKNTHTYNTFLMTRKRIPKFVSRQNENVRVAEDLLTDKYGRVKHSDRGSRSLKDR